MLFGYRLDDLDRTAYFKEGGVCSSIWDASLFERENYSGKDGWASPSAWAQLFRTDPELSVWRFRPIGTCRKKSAKGEYD